MESQVLAIFLQGIVREQKRDRYAGYLSSEKGKRKLLAALDHELERDIEPKRIGTALSENEWSQAGILLSSSGMFGREFPSVRIAYEDAPWEGGWLLIGATATYGVYRPEGRAGCEVVVKL